MRQRLTAFLLLFLSACASTPGPVGAGEPGSTSTPAPTHPELAAQLLELAERDQAARGALVEAMSSPVEGGGFQLDPGQAELLRAVEAIDAESTAFLRGLVADTGWPT
ncbi:MAG: hypothetical protein P1V81_09695 [Planctomycetota bacterium]|nr:hypothetical protein [Planctomycetota bacterium]